MKPDEKKPSIQKKQTIQKKRDTLKGMFRAFLTLYIVFAIVALFTGSCAGS